MRPHPFAPLARAIATRALMSRLSIRKHAHYDATRSPPIPHGDQLAATELTLVERFEHKLDTLERKREQALGTVRVEAIQTKLCAAPAACTDIVSATRYALYELYLKFLVALRPAVTEVAAREKEVQQFKDQNLLTRDAYDHDPALGWAVVFTLLMIESSLNGTLFADVSEWGEAGGFLTAAVLSLPNIAAGLLAGFGGLRALHHIQPTIRFCGGAILAIAIAIALFWAAFVAHLRLIAATPKPDAAATTLGDWHGVLTSMSDNFLAPLDLPAAVSLMLLGLAAFLIAVLDGLDGFSDRYPGFSRVDRRLRQAKAKVRAITRKSCRQVEYKARSAEAAITHQRREINRSSTSALLILNRARDMVTVFAQRAADQLHAHRLCLAEYHALNARQRAGDTTIPARFSDAAFPARRQALPDYDWQSARRTLTSHRDHALAVTKRAIDELEAARLATITRMETESGGLTDTPPSLPAPSATPEAV